MTRQRTPRSPVRRAGDGASSTASSCGSCIGSLSASPAAGGGCAEIAAAARDQADRRHVEIFSLREIIS